MWLLNTHTAELKFFVGPDDVPGGYAILSHVWGKAEEEDTFQSVQSAFQDLQRRAGRFADQATTSQQTQNDAPSPLLDRLGRLEHRVDRLAVLLHQGLLVTLQMRGQDTATTPGLSLGATTPGAPITPVHATPLTPPAGARDQLSRKVRSFLIKAEEHGFDWAWSDTCCIDKTSSAELTEAINSMFHYYSCSDVCYVYLHDVPSGCDPTSPGSAFTQSRWYKRGWTLQELLAPKNVVFMAQDWSYLGTKYGLADVLEQNIYNIPPARVLRFETDMSEMSVAQRMSWAAYRTTTRVEDEAYSLFGLFGVNMPTLYGEGRNAFYRLQEAIMNTSPDTSLLAWLGVLHCGVADVKGEAPVLLRYSRKHQPTLYPYYHLLAPSVRYFVGATQIVSSRVPGRLNAAATVGTITISTLMLSLNFSPK